ncbi:hypothetical protein ACWEGS_26490 [Streptomyces sp. NPDC004822]|uniref:hypothetical protein n=1 Tax=unclassified Streptomyces TaxID=2593676 RepID=UPI00178C6C6E|nr:MULTISPECIES: hypothetical protein [unclassified Streptomyces]MDI9835713.1 hypothetical protein [Streptomyces sp. KAU_LT]
MRPGRHDARAGEADSALADEAAGYLLVHDHHVQACREAAELCARLPWLTTAQAEDVSRHYVQQRVDLTRRTLRATAERAGQLREEYEARYAELRRALLRRYALAACALVSGTGGAGALVSLLGR